MSRLKCLGLETQTSRSRDSNVSVSRLIRLGIIPSLGIIRLIYNPLKLSQVQEEAEDEEPEMPPEDEDLEEDEVASPEAAHTEL